MKRFLFALFVSIFVTSCAGWQRNAENTLDYIHQAGRDIRVTYSPVINGWCTKERDACIAAKDPTCPGLKKCSSVRKGFAYSLLGLQGAILDAKIALSLDDQDGTTQAILKGMQLLVEVKEQLQKFGLLK